MVSLSLYLLSVWACELEKLDNILKASGPVTALQAHNLFRTLTFYHFHLVVLYIPISSTDMDILSERIRTQSGNFEQIQTEVIKYLNIYSIKRYLISESKLIYENNRTYEYLTLYFLFTSLILFKIFIHSSKSDNIHIIMDKIICYSLKIHIKLFFLTLTKIASKILK